MGLPIVYLKELKVEFLNYDVYLSMKVVLNLTNNADPDEMQHYAAFHLGLHCLPKYTFKGLKGKFNKFLYPTKYFIRKNNVVR